MHVMIGLCFELQSYSRVCRTFMLPMIHLREVHLQDLFKYIDILVYVEATIYSVDEANENLARICLNPRIAHQGGMPRQPVYHSSTGYVLMDALAVKLFLTAVLMPASISRQWYASAGASRHSRTQFV